MTVAVIREWGIFRSPLVEHSVARAIIGVFVASLLSVTACDRRDTPIPAGSNPAATTRPGKKMLTPQPEAQFLATPANPLPSVPPTEPMARPQGKGAPREEVGVPAWLPLKRAREGQWAAYRTLAGRQLRYEVDKITPSAVHTRVVMRASGALLGIPAYRDDDPEVDPLAAQAAADGAERRSQPALIQVAGREWRTTLYEDLWTDEQIAYVRRTWVSNEVPVFGIVRMELAGADQLEARLELNACSHGLGKETHSDK